MCAGCLVRQPCLDYAIANRISHGVWGGLTGRERRALQSRWVRASRRNRDGAISAAVAAGYTVEAVGRSFGLSRTSVARIVRTGTGTEPAPIGYHPGPDFVSGEPEARL